MRAVTWIESSQITSILFKASLPALWVLTLSNSISQPQYCAALKLTSASALFPGNFDCKQSVEPPIVQYRQQMLRYLSFNSGRGAMKYLNISLSKRQLLSKGSVMLGEKRERVSGKCRSKYRSFLTERISRISSPQCEVRREQHPTLASILALLSYMGHYSPPGPICPAPMSIFPTN